MSKVLPRVPDSVRYELPIIVHHDGQSHPACLSVNRLNDGSFWEGLVFVHAKLWSEMEQAATSLNGGHGNLSREEFLTRVRLVFDFCGGVDFDFVTQDEETALKTDQDAVATLKQSGRLN